MNGANNTGVLKLLTVQDSINKLTDHRLNLIETIAICGLASSFVCIIALATTVVMLLK